MKGLQRLLLITAPAILVAAVDIAAKTTMPLIGTTHRLTVPLFGIALLVGAFSAVRMSRKPHQAVGLGFILGGAIGNGWDLLLCRCVRDVFAVGQVMFNVADIGIIVGLLIILLPLIPLYKKW